MRLGQSRGEPEESRAFAPPWPESASGIRPFERKGPTETGRTVQRLAGLGYDWHNVMHLVMGPATGAVYHSLAEKRPFDRADYVRQLAELPGDWPPPEELGLH